MSFALVYGVFLKEKAREHLLLADDDNKGLLERLKETSSEAQEVILGDEDQVLSLPVVPEGEFPPVFKLANAGREFRHGVSWAKRGWKKLAKLIERESKGKIKLGEPELLIVQMSNSD